MARLFSCKINCHVLAGFVVSSQPDKAAHVCCVISPDVQSIGSLICVNCDGRSSQRGIGIPSKGVADKFHPCWRLGLLVGCFLLFKDWTRPHVGVPASQLCMRSIEGFETSPFETTRVKVEDAREDLRCAVGAAPERGAEQ